MCLTFIFFQNGSINSLNSMRWKNPNLQSLEIKWEINLICNAHSQSRSSPLYSRSHSPISQSRPFSSYSSSLEKQYVQNRKGEFMTSGSSTVCGVPTMRRQLNGERDGGFNRGKMELNVCRSIHLPISFWRVD